MYRPTIHPSVEGVVRVEAPYRTFLNDKQEGWSLFDNGFRVGRALRTRWDMVYGFSHKPDCLLPGLAAKTRGAKLVLDWSDWWGGPEGLYRACVLNSDWFQALPRPLKWTRRAVFAAEEAWEPKIVGFADAVTLISSEFLAHPRIPSGLARKSHVMHSGAPLKQIEPLEKACARAAIGLNFPPNACVFGYVANYHTDETLLMEAFAQICREREDARMLVVGSDFEKTRPDLHEATHDRIRHVGRKPFEEIGLYLAAADILLLPLRDVALDRARYPHKLSDYVAAGRPVIACDVGETGRLLRRFNFGTLTPATSEGFARGMATVASTREQWEEMGRATRRAAEEHFNWDRMCDGLFEFLHHTTGLGF